MVPRVTAFLTRAPRRLSSSRSTARLPAESLIGRWLSGGSAPPREQLVIATKVFFGGGQHPNGNGLSRPAILTCLSKSLARLGTSYIDIYQIHAWDALTAVDDWMSTFRDLVSAGTIRALGVSNVTGWQLQKIVTAAADHKVPLASLQTQYSLLCREPEFELLDCAHHNRISTLCWSPLKGGWLSGKFTRGSPPDATSRVGRVESGATKRLQSNPSYSQFADDERVWRLLAALERIAQRRGWTVPQVALRWVLQRPTVACVVVGARTMDQLTDNLGAAMPDGPEGQPLTDEEMAELTAQTAPELPYPYEMVWRVSARGTGRQDGVLWPISRL